MDPTCIRVNRFEGAVVHLNTCRASEKGMLRDEGSGLELVLGKLVMISFQDGIRDSHLSNVLFWLKG